MNNPLAGLPTEGLPPILLEQLRWTAESLTLLKEIDYERALVAGLAVQARLMRLDGDVVRDCTWIILNAMKAAHQALVAANN